MKITNRLFSLSAAVILGSTVSFAQVSLQNATATYSQTFNGPWNASEMIDGDLSVDNGWAVFDGNTTSAQTSVFETVSDLSTPGLQITMTQNYSGFPGHFVGRFRWSATTDSRGDFADGLQTGGDVTANWSVLTPFSVSAPAGFSSSILGDGSVLMSLTSGAPPTASYVLNFGTALSSVTGLRLEVMEDPSLPTNGPGLYSNGNFVLTEVNVEAVPEPATMLVLGSGIAMMLRRRKRAN